jgi:pimeloyl-ACP methyl ester carboxylesterase
VTGPASGAAAPERSRFFASDGVRLRVDEWGSVQANVVLLHGAFDHGRGFDLLAPLLAERFHVLSLTSRGHGDSEWVDSYAWWSDVAHAVNLLRSLGRPAHLVGHSRGGGQATDAALWAPDCVRRLVNIDGFGPPPEGFSPPGVPIDERPPPPRFREYLDRRRRATERAWRPYPSLEDLVERRREQNPRLSREWLRYFLFHGAREVEGGWVWKTDPEFAGGFDPGSPSDRPGWTGLRTPMLAMVGTEPDAWRLDDAVASERLAFVPELVRAAVPDAGHFVHMEQPRATADLLLGFLEP